MQEHTIKWIDVKQELPLKRGIYLVTYILNPDVFPGHQHERRVDIRYFTPRGSTSFSGRKSMRNKWHESRNRIPSNCVIAWAFLPAPYSEAEDLGLSVSALFTNGMST